VTKSEAWDTGPVGQFWVLWQTDPQLLEMLTARGCSFPTLVGRLLQNHSGVVFYTA